MCTTIACETGMFESSPCTATSDRVCSAVPVLGGLTGCFNFEENSGPSAFAALATIDFAHTITSASISFAKTDTEGTDILAFADTASVTGTVHQNSLEFVMDLTAVGDVTAENFAAALQNVHFNTEGDMAGHNERRVNVVLKVCHKMSEQEFCSAPTLQCIKILPVNDQPVVNAPAQRVNYTQNGAPIVLEPALTITDADDKMLASAMVQVVSGENDVLAFTATDNITGVIGVTDSTSTINFHGVATVAEYQAVLRSVTYATDAISSVTRTVSIFVQDQSGGVGNNTVTSATNAMLEIGLCSPAGSFNNIGANILTACPAGKFQVAPCLNECTSCAAGRHGAAGVTGASTAEHCTDCAIGTYQPLVASVNCTACAAGRFGAGTNHVSESDHCVPCNAGTFQGAAGESSCKPCAEGEFSLGDAISCSPWTTCGPGVYKSGNAVDTDGICAVCATGSYKDTTSLANCTLCTAGSKGVGAIDVALSTHCVDCSLGEFSAADGATACNSCTAGDFNNAEGQSSCKACPMGTWQSEPASSACVDCTVGKYGKAGIPSTSDAHCVTCAHGSVAAAEGLSACVPCEAGTYADIEVPTHDTSHCKSCIAGTFQDVIVFAEECKACPSGSFQPSSSNKATSCTACSGACAAGEYESSACTAVLDRICSPIPALGGIAGSSYYNENQPVASVPAIAATVTFDSTIASAVVEIVGGNTNDMLNATTTETSITSSFASGTLHLSGEATAAQYESVLRTVSFAVKGEMRGVTAPRTITLKFSVCHAVGVCSLAKETTVWVTPVNDTPIAMVSGTFSFTQSGAAADVFTNLQLSDADDTTLEAANVTIAPVTAGDVLTITLPVDTTITSQYDAVTATLSLAGSAPLAQYQTALRTITFSSTIGANLSTVQRTIAISVSDGQHDSASMPQVTVDVCAARGFFADIDDATSVCATGTFAAEACATECTKCAAGTHGSATINTASAGHCVTCAQGTYQSAEAQVTCDSCAAGTFGNASVAVTSAAHCQLCAAGTFSTVHGATECTKCNAGSFTSDLGAATCAPCSAGKFVADLGATECTKCAVGTSSDAEGATTASTCVACASGSYTMDAGSATCLPWKCCPAGTESLGASATTPGFCNACGYGYFRPTASCSAEPCQSWGTPCAAGKFMWQASSTQTGTCESCNPGSYKSSAGFEACTDCAAGKFGDLPGLTSEPAACDACATGQYAVSPGAIACTACAAGEYGDEGVGKETQAHCKTCTATPWSDYGACTKTCSGGTTTRTRQLTGASAVSTDAEAQCPVVDTKPCNSQSCPGRHHCHYLKCRYSFHAATDNYAIQVYHHHKEPHNVHHCKLYETASGERQCHCFCWYTDQNGVQNGKVEQS
jgi:hypothetical protein